MSMRRTEEQFQTRGQARDYLRTALELVAELDPPEDLRAAVFAKAADLVSAKQVFFEQVAPLGALSIPQNARH